MSSPYLPRIGPVIGGGLPGLPQRTPAIGGDPAGRPLQTILLRLVDGDRQTFITPSWATYARVTAQGRGGQGLKAPGTSGGAHGGGGSGCAATFIKEISPSTAVDVVFGAQATLVDFLNYRLSGGNGGAATGTAGGAPGIGSGGDINFNGGAGATASSGANSGGGGGGAAGRGGDGVAGGSGGAPDAWAGNSGPGDAHVTGGGAGGAGQDTGGIRYGAISRTDASQLGALLVGTSTETGRGTTPANCSGGDGGGGSGGSVSGLTNIPGAGWALIELW